MFISLDYLKKLTVCPVLKTQMKDPCVTPSGHTIDGKAMSEWICKLVI